MSLSEEQRQRIEENKRRALAIRAAKLAANSPSKSNVNTNFEKVNSFVSDSVPKSVNSARNTPVSPTAKKDTHYSRFGHSCKKPTSPYKNGCLNNKTADVSVPNFYNRTEKRNILLSCSLSSKDRFSVDINSCNKDLTEVLNKIPGRRYDSRTQWSFPISEYQNLKNAVNGLGQDILFGSIPNYVLKTFSKRSSIDVRDIELCPPVDEVLFHNLYPFQREGVQFGVSKDGRCIIADDMGLGKTIQALGIAHYYYHDWPLLIVCPSSMRYQWEQEIMSCLPSVSLVRLFVMSSSKDKVNNPQVVITSYDLMSRMVALLMSFKFGVVIMDESHSIKSMTTNRTKAALKLIQNAQRCILLSGTPALSRPIELYPQMKAIDPHLLSMKEFGVRYCEGKRNRFGWDFSGSSNMAELKLLLEERFMIRRLKSDVLDQLPSKIREIVILDSEKVKIEKKVMSEFTFKLNKPDVKGIERRGTLLEYFTETAKAKINAVQEYIARLLEDGRKFLVFAHHKLMMDAVCAVLEQKHMYYIRIDGSTNSEERKSVCDQFQFEERFKVAVLSVTAAGTGITLTSAHLVVFAELFWNPGVLTQAEDRVHRIGQQDSVLVQYLIAKGTADDYLWPLVQEKLNILNKAGLSKDNFLCRNTSLKTSSHQSSILDYFSELDHEELSNVLNEVETVETKRLKLSDSA